MPGPIFESGQSNCLGSWLLSAAAASEHDLTQGHWRKEFAAVEQLYGDISGALENNLSCPPTQLRHYQRLIRSVSIQP
jgi:hypothetical protein